MADNGDKKKFAEFLKKLTDVLRDSFCKEHWDELIAMAGKKLDDCAACCDAMNSKIQKGVSVVSVTTVKLERGESSGVKQEGMYDMQVVIPKVEVKEEPFPDESLNEAVAVDEPMIEEDEGLPVAGDDQPMFGDEHGGLEDPVEVNQVAPENPWFEYILEGDDDGEDEDEETDVDEDDDDDTDSDGGCVDGTWDDPYYPYGEDYDNEEEADWETPSEEEEWEPEEEYEPTDSNGEED